MPNTMLLTTQLPTSLPSVMPLMLVMLVLPTSLVNRLPLAVTVPAPVPLGRALSLTVARSSAAADATMRTVAVSVWPSWSVRV